MLGRIAELEAEVKNLEAVKESRSVGDSSVTQAGIKIIVLR